MSRITNTKFFFYFVLCNEIPYSLAVVCVVHDLHFSFFFWGGEGGKRLLRESTQIEESCSMLRCVWCKIIEVCVCVLLWPAWNLLSQPSPHITVGVSHTTTMYIAFSEISARLVSAFCHFIPDAVTFCLHHKKYVYV